MIIQMLNVYVELLLICSQWSLTGFVNTLASPQANASDSIRDHQVAFLRRSCPCQNGGTCILGSFCDCNVGFKGRYCEEEEIHTRPCGDMTHNTEKLDFTGNCRLCRCFDGTIVCDEDYTCDDLSNYANLRSIHVSKNSKDISLSISNGHNEKPSPSQDIVIVLPHSDNVSDSAVRMKISHSWIIFLFLLHLFLFLT